MTIQLCDETIPGKRTHYFELDLPSGPVTLRDILRRRVRQEVERYNQSLPETFQGLVQPEESEQLLNGYRLKTRRPLDWEAQFRQACASFQKNGFLILIDDRQVTELDTAIPLRAESTVHFIKLVPLVGG